MGPKDRDHTWRPVHAGHDAALPPIDGKAKEAREQERDETTHVECYPLRDSSQRGYADMRKLTGRVRTGAQGPVR